MYLYYKSWIKSDCMLAQQIEFQNKSHRLLSNQVLLLRSCSEENIKAPLPEGNHLLIFLNSYFYTSPLWLH